MRVTFSRGPLRVSSPGGCGEQFWHWQGPLLFDVLHPAFCLLATNESRIEKLKTKRIKVRSKRCQNDKKWIWSRGKFASACKYVTKIK